MICYATKCILETIYTSDARERRVAFCCTWYVLTALVTLLCCQIVRTKLK